MLEKIDLDKNLTKEEYHRLIPVLQNRLYDLERALYVERIPVMIVFEGWNAAGKGDTIKAISKRLDPRGFRVVAVKAPRETDRLYPWLWRFWLKIPAYGQIVLFDTSWYRRVLMDRIKKDAGKEDRRRAYRDISEFEETLAADGTVILKFWFQISKDEQAKRFKKLKRNKLTAWQVSKDDMLQQKEHKKFVKAVEEMFKRTHVPTAPWIIVEATDRHYTRVKIVRTIIGALEKRLGKKTPKARGNGRNARGNAG
jgi:polyphosphate kinase 2 (PPK2 family)